MCGIAGILNFDAERVDPDLLRRMIGMVGYRGPDGQDLYTDGGVGLAHARLSIIDLAGGRQPMSNRDQSIWITFNGEIFNYVELREELVRRGHRFATQSDTEVILHLYEEHGEDCVRFFNGQWAFAVWDSARRKLFLSRDRLGVRPLVYTVAGRSLIFGSEIKSLFAHPSVRRAIDPHALDQLCTVWTTIPPKTIFHEVLELPPGHSMTVQDGKIDVRPYWRLEYPRDPEPMDEQACADRLLELLTDATRIRLRSDVPVGAYLSGGLDSSLLTALILRVTNAPLKTFSVAFEDADFDESGYQRDVIRFLNTDHQEVRCSSRDIGLVFPDVVWHTEKPVLRTAPAPLFLLSRLVRDQGFKVVLTGEGSDEMLGGYDIFKEAKIRRFWAARPGSRRRPLLLRRLYPYLRDIQHQSDAYLQAFFHVRPEERVDPLFSHLPRWELTSRIKLFFSDAVRAEISHDEVYSELRRRLPEGFAQWPFLSQAQHLEATYLLPGYILSSQGDRMAMAHSVEGRSPFLDHRVVEYAAAIPPILKMKVLNEKYILKRCATGLIPESVRRRPKQPYMAPDIPSFFGPDEAPYLDAYLSDGALRRAGVFDPRKVGQLLEKCRKGRRQGFRENMALVAILSTQIVYDRFVANFVPKETPHG